MQKLSFRQSQLALFGEDYPICTQFTSRNLPKLNLDIFARVEARDSKPDSRSKKTKVKCLTQH